MQLKKTILFLFLLLMITITNSQSVIFEEDFENLSALPPGWTEIISTPSSPWKVEQAPWSHYLIIPYHSNIAAFNEGESNISAPNESLITPGIDLSSYTSAYLSFDVFFKEMTYQDITESLSIEATVDNGASWQAIESIEGYFNWQKVFCDVSALCGNPNVKFAFKYSDNGGWLYGTGLDNVQLLNPYETDGALQSVIEYEFVQLGEEIFLQGVILNMGIEIVHSFDLSWQVNNGTIYTTEFKAGIIPCDTLSFIHPDGWTPLSQESYDVKIWISKVNGISDINPSNDTLDFRVVNAVSEKPDKKVFLEVFGSNWCTLCPHASDVISEIKLNTDNLIVAVIHYDDPFSCIQGNAIFNNYHLFPGWLVSGLIDRHDFSDQTWIDMDRYLWPHHVYMREDDISPLDLTISNSFDPSTREVIIDLEATFLCDLQGDLRFNCYIVEDSIVFPQDNCLTIPDREPFCHKEWWIYSSSYTIENYVHMNVLRDVLGGEWGTAGSIPANVASGNMYVYEYSYTLPPEFDEENIRIIGIVQKFDFDTEKCDVYNARSMYLDNSTGTESVMNEQELIRIYPNPVKDHLFIDLAGTEVICFYILDINGRQILHSKINKGKAVDLSGLEPGIYLVKVEGRNMCSTSKIVIL